MKLPNKIIAYTESDLPLFPYVLKFIKENDITPMELHKKTKKKIPNIEFLIEILDYLFILEKIILTEKGVLHYVM